MIDPKATPKPFRLLCADCTATAEILRVIADFDSLSTASRAAAEHIKVARHDCVSIYRRSGSGRDGGP